MRFSPTENGMLSNSTFKLPIVYCQKKDVVHSSDGGGGGGDTEELDVVLGQTYDCDNFYVYGDIIVHKIVYYTLTFSLLVSLSVGAATRLDLLVPNVLTVACR